MGKRKALVGSIIVVVFGICLLWYYLWPYQGLRYSCENEYPAVNNHVLVELGEGRDIVQEFQTENIHFKGLQYYLIREPEQEGTFCVEISDSEGNMIAKREIALPEIGNGEWYYDFFNATLDKRQLYKIRFYAEGSGGGKALYGLDGQGERM